MIVHFIFLSFTLNEFSNSRELSFEHIRVNMSNELACMDSTLIETKGSHVWLSTWRGSFRENPENPASETRDYSGDQRVTEARMGTAVFPAVLASLAIEAITVRPAIRWVIVKVHQYFFQMIYCFEFFVTGSARPTGWPWPRGQSGAVLASQGRPQPATGSRWSRRSRWNRTERISRSWQPEGGQVDGYLPERRHRSLRWPGELLTVAKFHYSSLSVVFIISDFCDN